MKRALVWLTRGMLLLILAAVAAPFLVPMERLMPHLLPQLEQRLSQLSGRPVTIGRLRLEILPQPALRAEGISLWSAREKDRTGDGERQGELFIKHLAIQPDLGRLLFEQRWVLSGIELKGVATNEAFIRSLIDLAQNRTAPRAPPPQQIETLSAGPVTIRLDNGRLLGPYRARLSFGPGNTLQRLSAARVDERLRLHLAPAPAGYVLRLEGRRWTLPLPPALHFDTLDAEGRLTPSGLSFSRLAARAYGGRIQGGAEMRWRDGWRLLARLSGADIAMAPIIRLFGGSGFRGDFHGELAITLKARRFADLLRNPQVEGPFRITQGLIGRDPARPLLSFEAFSARGRLDRSGIETRDSRLQAYGGSITGKQLALRWRPHWTFAGRLKASGLDSEALLAGFLDQKVIAGRFSGQAEVELQGRRFAELFVQPRLAGTIRLQQGMLYRTDLEKAGASLGRETEGQTPFHDLQARVRMVKGQVSVEDLKITSTVLQASGGFELDAADRLSGTLDVGLQHTGFLASIPLTIGGTRSDPHLRPSNAALLGGVAGSSLMGPGLGTALGVKVGDTMEKLGRKLRQWRRRPDDPDHKD